MTERELFENWVRETYVCNRNSFTTNYYGYYGVVSTRNTKATPDYADVSMLWNTWQASAKAFRKSVMTVRTDVV